MPSDTTEEELRQFAVLAREYLDNTIPIARRMETHKQLISLPIFFHNAVLFEDVAFVKIWAKDGYHLQVLHVVDARDVEQPLS
jgi:hypothetical protein